MLAAQYHSKKPRKLTVSGATLSEDVTNIAHLLQWCTVFGGRCAEHEFQHKKRRWSLCLLGKHSSNNEGEAEVAETDIVGCDKSTVTGC